VSDRLNELHADAAKAASNDFHEVVVDWMEEAAADLARQRTAISTMAFWLVQAQTGFAERDVRGIEAILKGEKP
jgi:hypothetical protein